MKWLVTLVSNSLKDPGCETPFQIAFPWNRHRGDPIYLLNGMMLQEGHVKLTPPKTKRWTLQMMGFSIGISYFQVPCYFFGGYTLRQSNIAGWKSYIVTNSRTTSIQMISQPAMLDYWTLAYVFLLKRSKKIWFEGPRRF